MPRTRRQLSMYIPPEQASIIETVRSMVDPIQHQLIPAHVTLCRDNELNNFAGIEDRLQVNPHRCVELTFGRPEVFHGHGILMECIAGLSVFQLLREFLLGPACKNAQLPHLTLAHPRNPKAAGNSPENTGLITTPFHAVLDRIVLIEQEEDSPWTVLREYGMPSGDPVS